MWEDVSVMLHTIAWPAVLLLAWWLGERLHAVSGLPRVSIYVAVGLVAGLLTQPGIALDSPGLAFLANVALALVLFELGHRIHLRWFRHNPWVLIVGVVESFVTFGLVYAACGWFDMPAEVRLMVAALSMSASPAGIVRVANELRGSGQVTERVMHLCAINCLLAVLVVKLVVGYAQLRVTGDWLGAVGSSLYALVASLGLGAAFGVLAPRWVRVRSVSPDALTVAYALAVVLLIALAHALRLSPLLAALAFGVLARETRVQLLHTQRDFGSLGRLLSLFLFVYVASLIRWPEVWPTLGLALVVIVVRAGSKVLCNVLVARPSGITVRKGVLTGLALMPMSAFAILLLEQNRLYGFAPGEAVFGVMSAMMLLQELLGPWVTQRSLVAARETEHLAQVDY